MGLLEDMSCPPNELWAHSGEHGWIVYDDNDPRNSGPGRRVIIRCKDWAEIEVPRGEPKPPAYVPFRMYFNCLGGREVEREVANLLALQHSFALRKHEIVARAQESVRRQQEETARQQEQRRQQARVFECQRTTTLLEVRAAEMATHAALATLCAGRELTYEELLNTAEWHRRRVQILARDEYRCQQCGREGVGADNHALQVHHRYYIINKLPWDYADGALMTLCKACHTKLHEAGRVLVYEEVDGKLVRRKLKPCIRCLGAGFFPQWEHIEAGICFRCHGARFDVEVYVNEEAGGV